MTHNITGTHRKAYARQIHKRLARGMTPPAICAELGITTKQLEGLVKQYVAPPVRVITGRTADCPACHIESEVKNGRIAPHQILGPGRRGIRVAVNCWGSGTWIQITEGAKAA